MHIDDQSGRSPTVGKFLLSHAQRRADTFTAIAPIETGNSCTGDFAVTWGLPLPQPGYGLLWLRASRDRLPPIRVPSQMQQRALISSRADQQGNARRGADQ